MTDGNPNEARSAFFTNPVNVQQFITSFDFQLTNAIADGFTFTIQGDGPTVLGRRGELWVTAVLTTSVIVKFDLFNNAGEGPTLPACTRMAQLQHSRHRPLSDGVNLHSGDIFNVQMTYNGTTLTVVITDTVTNAIGDADLHRQYPCDRRRHDGLCGIYGRQRRSDCDPGDTELEL